MLKTYVAGSRLRSDLHAYTSHPGRRGAGRGHRRRRSPRRGSDRRPRGTAEDERPGRQDERPDRQDERPDR
ncbi:hypothetical protein DMH18_18100 [Streptomyces sp. WAC 06783]|nr:hypothetical protein DMH18_18100 [Streptomyces sp. WAC 06783]